MKILIFAASLRKDSVNKKLAKVTADVVTEAGAEVDLADFSEFDVPLFNGDLDGDEKPKGATVFRDRLTAADALMIVSPEYNFSMPGTVKNLIDWVSRFRPTPWGGSKIMLLSASPSGVGGNRGLWQLRIPLEGLGAFVFPAMFSLSSAFQAFDESGNLTDGDKRTRLKGEVENFLKTVKALSQ